VLIKRGILKIEGKKTVKSNMRKVLIFLLPLYAGYAIYSILNLMYGASGIFAMRDLVAYKQVLEQNIASIEENYEKLTAELNGLKNDIETLTLEARNIGYYDSAEGVIKVEGYNPEKNYYPVGKLLRHSYPPAFKKTGFRTVSLAVVLMTVIFILFIKKKTKRKPHKL
jgi:cell division protein FtsB